LTAVDLVDQRADQSTAHMHRLIDWLADTKIQKWCDTTSQMDLDGSAHFPMEKVVELKENTNLLGRNTIRYCWKRVVIWYVAGSAKNYLGEMHPSKWDASTWKRRRLSKRKQLPYLDPYSGGHRPEKGTYLIWRFLRNQKEPKCNATENCVKVAELSYSGVIKKSDQILDNNQPKTR